MVNYLSLPLSEAAISPASLIKPGLIVSPTGEDGPFARADRPETRLTDQQLGRQRRKRTKTWFLLQIQTLTFAPNTVAEERQ